MITAVAEHELDGAAVPAAALRALALHNYGHFTTLRVADGRVRGLGLHLDRLARDCRTLFDAALDVERVRHLVRRVAPSGGTAVVRVTVFAPDLDLAAPSRPVTPRVLVGARPAPEVDQPPIRLTALAYRRDQPAVKHVGLFGPLYHRRRAQLAGFEDALYTDADGLLAEGTTWNLGIVDGDGLVWPDAERLQGVTMTLLGTAYGSESTRVLHLDDLAQATVTVVTNAAVGVRAVGSVDGRVLPQDPRALTRLREAYASVPLDRL